MYLNVCMDNDRGRSHWLTRCLGLRLSVKDLAAKVRDMTDAGAVPERCGAEVQDVRARCMGRGWESMRDAEAPVDRMPGAVPERQGSCC